MLKKMIGAAIGAKLARKSPAVGGATGALLGAAVPFVISRVSIPALVAVGVGGYAAKRYMEKRSADGGKRNSGAGQSGSRGNATLSLPTRPEPSEATGGEADIINEPPMGAAGGLIEGAPGGPDSAQGAKGQQTGDEAPGTTRRPPSAIS